MFDKLIEFLISIWDQVLPFETIDHYNRGARLRFGKAVRCLEPGLHFKWPFINSTLLMMIKMKTIKLSEQSIRTNDGVSVVVKAIVKYEVEDVMRAALEVNDPVDAIADMTQGIIKRMVSGLTWTECEKMDMENEVAKKARVEAKKWGLKIIEVNFSDFDQITSFRLLNSSVKDETYD
jgi:regulator of protease activity HflC (stomatin/prohibitin superfamily)